MGICVYAYLVDWDELTARWQKSKKKTRGPHWFQQAVDDQETWVTYYQPKNWIDSWNAAVDAGLFYDNAREDLKPALRKQIDKYLRPFISTSASFREHFRDLSKSDTEDGLFEITMSPTTVKDFCAHADFKWLDALRPLWDEHNEMWEGEEYTHISSFAAFKRYMGQWQKLLQAAQRKKKGLVISVA